MCRTSSSSPYGPSSAPSVEDGDVVIAAYYTTAYGVERLSPAKGREDADVSSEIETSYRSTLLGRHTGPPRLVPSCSNVRLGRSGTIDARYGRAPIHRADRGEGEIQEQNRLVEVGHGHEGRGVREQGGAERPREEGHRRINPSLFELAQTAADQRKPGAQLNDEQQHQR